MFWSKIISGEVRESGQPRTMAKGCWAWAVSTVLAAVGLAVETLFVTKRALPSLSFASAASGPTEGAGARRREAKFGEGRDERVLKSIIHFIELDGLLYLKASSLRALSWTSPRKLPRRSCLS